MESTAWLAVAAINGNVLLKTLLKRNRKRKNYAFTISAITIMILYVVALIDIMYLRRDNTDSHISTLNVGFIFAFIILYIYDEITYYRRMIESQAETPAPAPAPDATVQNNK